MSNYRDRRLAQIKVEAVIDEAKEIVKRLTADPPVFATAYEAGYDCGTHGANQINCHFRWFRSPTSMAEWEHGKRMALEEKP